MAYLMLFSSYNYDVELEEVISYSPVMIIMQECIKLKDQKWEEKKGLLTTFNGQHHSLPNYFLFISREELPMRCHQIFSKKRFCGFSGT
jgi:hypothetical protein